MANCRFYDTCITKEEPSVTCRDENETRGYCGRKKIRENNDIFGKPELMKIKDPRNTDPWSTHIRYIGEGVRTRA